MPWPSIVPHNRLNAPSNSTNYASIAQIFTQTTTEALVQVRVPDGVFSSLSFRVITISGSEVITVRLRVNGANGNLVVACPPGTTGRFTDVSNTDTVADGDLVAVSYQGSGGFGTKTLGFATSLLFEADDPVGGPVAWWGSIGSAQSGSWTGISVLPLGGELNQRVAVAAPRQQTVRAPGEVSNLRCAVTTNTADAAHALALNVNGSQTGLSVSIPAGTTGQFEDAANTVMVTDGDLVAFGHDRASISSGNVVVNNVTARFVGSTQAHDVFAGAGSIVAGQNNFGSAAALIGPVGRATASATASDREILLPVDARASNLRMTITGGTSVTFDVVSYVNGSPGLQTTTYTGTAADDVEDSINEDSMTAGDTFGIGKLAHSAGTANRTADIAAFTLAYGTPSESLAVPAGALVITGATPDLISDETIEPGAGSLIVTGAAPSLDAAGDLEPFGGSLEITGADPLMYVGAALTPGEGELAISGYQPLITTFFGVFGTQQAVMALVEIEPLAQVSQLGLMALAEIIPDARVSQQAALLLAEVVPDVAVSQQAVMVLAEGSPCVTRRCQIWTIERRDGVVFRFTSHDQDVTYGGQTYEACDSLSPSASENASKLGSVGNIELAGIIASDAITEADLFGGLFDDAFVTVDLVPWDGSPLSPRRIASGWTGHLSQGDTGFRMEVLGVGARLDQQALVQVIQPGCRWVFGDARCGVDVEAMKLTGEVTSALSRGRFLASLSAGPGAAQWENGRIRWTSGANAGLVVETKSVAFGDGDVILWAGASFLPAPGDTFDLLPGCDFAFDGGCAAYDNRRRFGGYPDVPGSDSILETPDAKY